MSSGKVTGTPRRPRRWRRFSGSHVAVMLVVSISAGLLFGAAASSADRSEVRSQTDFKGLVNEQNEAVSQLEADVVAAREDVDAVLAGLNASASSPPEGTDTSTDLSGEEVSGPGVTVTLTDAPANELSDADIDPDSLVVHQQDIDAVMNALWRGGAEAMTVQDVRIGATTEVRCVGNVITVDSQVFSPPFVISAIGDPEELTDSLDSDPQIAIYQQYVTAYGLGWDVTVSSHLTLAAVSTTSGLSYAQVVSDDG